MASPPPILTVLEESQVSPSPPAAIGGNRRLPLTFFDIIWLILPPIHTLFFYDLQITRTEFIENIIPNLKNSLSLTLLHFFPFAGKLVVFPTPTQKPEIRYVEGDYVSFTSAESTLDFNNLTGNHPRECDQFYHLIPPLGATTKGSDHIAIPLFSVQVTVFPNHGFSIGMTNHHSLGDASTRFQFLKAWASISQSGSDESFIRTGSFPCFDRSLVRYPELDEKYVNIVKVETFNEEYQPPSLSGPSDKVRVTVILTRTVIDRLKKLVSTRVPSLAYVSSFTVSCAYVWSCLAESRNFELELFTFAVDCRARMDPPIPATYFGNCVSGCCAIAKKCDLTGIEGFVTAAKMIGDNLHKFVTDKDGVVNDFCAVLIDLITERKPDSIIGISGTPKFKFYDLDFGWGKPRKYETISIDYNGSISMNASRESSEGLEIGVSLSATEMETFLRTFDEGLQSYI